MTFPKQVKFRRGRATSACEVCHARKVRCNMSEEFPCSNCRSFSIDCVPRIGKNKRKASGNDPTAKKLRPVEEVSSDSGSAYTATPSPKVTASPAVNQNSISPHGIGPKGISPSSIGSNTEAKPNFMAPNPVKTETFSPNSMPHMNANGYSPKNESLEQMQQQVRILGTATNISKQKPGLVSHKLFDQSQSSNALKSLFDMTTVGGDINTGQLEDAVLTRVLLTRPDCQIPTAAGIKEKGLSHALLIPNAEVSDHLIDTYFKYIHPYIPVINKTEFMKEYTYNRDSPSILIRQAMFSAACRLSTHPQLLDAKGSPTMASLEFYHRAKVLFDVNYDNSLHTLILASVILAQTVDDPMYINHNAFFWIRTGITLAQGLGMHRKKINQSAHTEQQKRRRIVWWCLYKRDIVSSMAFGQPAMINIEDCDVDMVTTNDFVSSEGPILLGSAASVLANAFVQSVKLHEILALIMKMQYTIGAERLRKMHVLLDATQCDRALADWVTQLPNELDIAKESQGFNDVSFKQIQYVRRLLYLEYYTVVSLSHRPQVAHLFQVGGTKEYPIWGIAFQAAHMILQIMESFEKDQVVRKLPGFAVYSCFSAVLLLSFQLRAAVDPSVRLQVSNALKRFIQLCEVLGKSHFTGSWVMFFAEELQNPRLASKIVRGMHQRTSSTNNVPEVNHTNVEPQVQPQQNFMNSQLPPPPVSMSNINEPQSFEPYVNDNSDYVQKLFPGDCDQFFQSDHFQMDFLPEMDSNSGDDTVAPNTMNMADWYSFLTKVEDDSNMF